MKFLRILGLSLICLAVASCSRPPNEVRISVGSYNLNNLPFFIAISQGYFEEEGLSVRTENFAQGGSKVLQALIGGSTDVAVGFYDHTIQMQAKFKDVTGFVLLSRNAGLVLAERATGRRDPNSAAGMRGARIGITAPGSSSEFFVRYHMQRLGASPNDYSLIGVGSGSSAVAALKQNKIDFLVNYDPAATYLVRSGVGRIAIDTRSDAGARRIYGGLYPTSVLYALPEFLEERPEAARKVARAMQKALVFIQTMTPEQIADAVPPGYRSGDRETYVEAITAARSIFSPDGRFIPADLETPLRVLKAFNRDVQRTEIDLTTTYTNTFVTGNAGAKGERKQ